MHETAVAQSVIETILAEMRKIDRRPVAARISCGQFNALNDEVMRFAFEVAAQDTPCRGMRLEIRHVPLQARCEGCGRAFAFNIQEACCPACGSEAFAFLPDAPLLLEEIEFEDESNDEGVSEQADPGS
ncbi:MAG TPA: hydrogenase maturation nickel metallochaperone HypA [Phycisphaerales bacterium]|nr:hydrogenase maturation nickel metallochaperone HypA [Phycisphaerales bacterium]